MNRRAFGEGQIAIGEAPVSVLSAMNSLDSSINAKAPRYGRVHVSAPHSVDPEISSITCVSIIQSSAVAAAIFHKHRIGFSR